MKFFFSFLTLLIFQVNLFSQGAPGMKSENLPPDEVFLHIDRNLYHPGDTIRFKAYIRDRQTGILETKSISLYSIIVKSTHQTIDSARFRIKNSLSSGWLKIPDTLQYGDYTIISFTSDMMNYDPEYIFSAPVSIRSPNIMKVKVDSEKENKISPAYQTPLDQSSVDLRWLPEGGTFINGINQRLAFNAVTSTGKSLEVSGVIFSKRGEKISEFKSGRLGPGFVEFTPLQEDSCYAVLNGAQFTGMEWPLPIPERTGVLLRINKNEDGMLDILIDGKGINEKRYLLTLMMNNVLVLSKGVKIESMRKFSIRTDQMPTGTAYLTLYDSSRNAVAERLVFVNSQNKMNIEISSTASHYRKGDEAEITINTIDKDGKNVDAMISVSVIDSITGYCSSLPLADIESSFLYDREFYENLPLSIKLKGLSGLSKEDLDLLMMTFGWRKFKSVEVTDNMTSVEMTDYDYIKLKSPATGKKVRDEIWIITDEGLDIFKMKTDKNNESIFRFDSLDNSVGRVMILPYFISDRNKNLVSVEYPQNKKFTDKAKLISNDFICLNTGTPAINNEELFFNTDSVIPIETVTIKAKSAIQKMSVKEEDMFKNAYSTTLNINSFINSGTFEDIIYRFNPFKVNKFEKKIYLRAAAYSLRGGYNPALVIIDNDPIYSNTYELIATLPASQIVSITIIKGPQGFARYGYPALGGIVFVSTKSRSGIINNIPYDPDLKEGNMKFVRLFRNDTEYYIPTKEEVNLIPEYRSRPTLLWQSELYVNKSGPIKIKYPNNMTKGTAIVIVNGVSVTNQVGTGRYIYQVR